MAVIPGLFLVVTTSSPGHIDKSRYMRVRDTVVGKSPPTACGLTNDNDPIRLQIGSISQEIDHCINLARSFYTIPVEVRVFALAVTFGPGTTGSAITKPSDQRYGIVMVKEPANRFAPASSQFHAGPVCR